MAAHPVVARLELALSELLARFSYDLVDLRYLHASGAWVLRVTIDHAQTPRFAPYGGGPQRHGGTVSVSDCENVSRIVSAWLDDQDAIPRTYHLEVSSPGLDRVLKREADFVRFAGRTCRIRTTQPVGDRRSFRGRIAATEAGEVVLESDDAGTVRIAVTGIERANLEPEIHFGRGARDHERGGDR